MAVLPKMFADAARRLWLATRARRAALTLTAACKVTFEKSNT
jgi:hypothetical protein